MNKPNSKTLIVISIVLLCILASVLFAKSSLNYLGVQAFEELQINSDSNGKIALALGTGLISIENIGIDEYNNSHGIIYAGNGYILNTSDANSPVLSAISWEQQIFEDIYRTTNLRTFVGIDKDGVVQLFQDEITPLQRRSNIQIGALTHIDGLTITQTNLAPLINYDMVGNIHDIGIALRSVNIDGNVYSGYNSTSLKLSKTEGRTYADNRNFIADAVSSNINTQVETSPVEFMFVAYRDGAGGQVVGVATDINTTHFDKLNNGNLSEIEDGFWVTHRIYTSPTTGSTTLVYGQEEHRGKIEALIQLKDEFFQSLTGTSELLLRGFITFKKGELYLGNNSNVVFTPADKFGISTTNRPVDGINLGTPSFKDYSFTNRGLKSGVFYIGGFYDYSDVDANLNQALRQVAHGLADVGYGSHAFIVAGGSGTVDTGQVGLRINCTTITDEGVLVIDNSEILTTDITTLELNKYIENDGKCLGQAIFELYIVSGSPTLFSLDFNYGYAKYEDWGNRDFMVTDFEAVGLADADDTGYDLALLKHQELGWNYTATNFIAGNGDIIRMSADYGGYDNLKNNNYVAYKRTDINAEIRGSSNEGVIIEITTTSSNAIQNINVHLGVEI